MIPQNNDKKRITFDSNPGPVRHLEKGFWILDTKQTSPYISKLFLGYLLCSRSQFNITKDSKLFDFVLAFVPKIKGNLLKKANEFKKNKNLYERLWQHEVYQAIGKILRSDISLNIEVPPFECLEEEEKEEEEIEQEEQDENGNAEIKNKGGFLDFYINGNIQWGIELLREGNTIKEHLDRFIKPNGKYSNMKFKEYLILDFKKSERRKNNIKMKNNLKLIN